MLRVELDDQVGVLTIDRPERRNAVDSATLDALAGALDGFGDDVRVVVLKGAGGHFCAGADLNGVEDQAFVALLNRVLVRLTEMPSVTLAAVDGAALGAGTQLAVACDLRVATLDASFGIPAAKLGLAVDSWTVERVCLLAGHGPARAMLLAAEVFSGERLHELGVVQRLGRPEDGVGWAREIAALAPLTLRAHKTALAVPPGKEPGAEATAAFERAWRSEDLQEGLAAFGERRRAKFRGQ
jgi:enoyl-CoA hydratase